ncbi:hypothetical protein GCM10028803_26480 [Larkinella knui]|uniref:Cobalamin-independent methionine synthase MetE C-terminal/archaeal domain-containing protein n=1 Tax=Larkinella knui TaxID=2025310 RepID=A0A3P1CWA8_9BACT|nr:hypothetical protein [Larkinella knui]RRB17697.1 hypothetical protein EHT87_05290 [Larkinella knui]
MKQEQPSAQHAPQPLTEFSHRSALLVGSLPFSDEEECMTRALDSLAPVLFCLPDGEIGEKSAAFPKGNRIAWVVYAIEKITEDKANWKTVKEPVRGEDGMAESYDHFQKLKPLRTPAEMPDHVTFGYDAFFRSSYPVFKRLRAERQRPDLKFQLGVPTGFAMGFAFASQFQWIRYTYAFNTVIAREVNAVLAEAGHDVIVQLEVPPELYAAYMLPSPLMGLALKPIKDLLAKINPGAQIGIHLCLGDFHNHALVHPKTLGKMVAFSNKLVDEWPSQHTLAYVHYPLAEGLVPPPTETGYYAPLKNIRLPKDTRFIAGFVHEKLSLDQNRHILASIETAYGKPVDVSTSCGLGRRTPETAGKLLAMMAELTR